MGTFSKDGMTSIIIVSWNTLAHTRLCVGSIREYTRNEEYELIVVDNASQDGSREWLGNQPDVKLIKNSKNVGYTAACNQGIKLARGKFIALLHSDTVVTSGWLENLKKALTSSREVGAVSCLTNSRYNYQNIDVPYGNSLESMQNFAARFNISDRSKWEKRSKLADFCLLLKSEVCRKIGVLDETFSPGFFEDDDYSLRMLEAGYDLLICADTFIFHWGGISFGKSGDEQQAADKKCADLYERNKQKLFAKWQNIPFSYSYIADDSVREYLTGNEVKKRRPKKIVACAMVENESDIIESFVRHTLFFADTLLVTDHLSTDGTGEILQKLQEEGLDVHVGTSREVTCNREKIMTLLMQSAITEYQADLVLLLDADQFLISSQGGVSTVREKLEAVPRLIGPAYYKLPWKNYEHIEPEKNVNDFILSRPARRESRRIVYGMAVADSHVVKKYNLEVGSNEFGLTLNCGDSSQIAMVQLEVIPVPEEELLLAHFPYRTRNQYLTKHMCGWLGYALRATRYSHIGQSYNAISRQYIKSHRAVLPRIKGAVKADLTDYEEECRNKYTRYRVDPLANLMEYAGKIVDYFQMEMARIAPKRLAVIFVCSDWQEYGDWLISEISRLPEQNYPIAQTIVLIHEQKHQEFKAYLTKAGYDNVIIVNLEEADTLMQIVDADYVQWLFEDEEMMPGRLQKLMCVLQYNPMACMIVSDVENKYEEKIEYKRKLSNEFVVESKSPKHWFNYLCKNGMYYPMIIGGAIFRVDVMKKVGFLAGLIRNNMSVLSLKTWLTLMGKIDEIDSSECDVYYLKEKFTRIKSERWIVNNIQQGRCYLSGWLDELEKLYVENKLNFNDYSTGLAKVMQLADNLEYGGGVIRSKGFNKKVIVHVMINDKFTGDYINFFKKRFDEYENIFITKDNPYKVELLNQDNVYWMQDYQQLVNDNAIKNIFKISSKIIMSGGWITAAWMDEYDDGIMEKLYIQMWGGDFYHVGDFEEYSVDKKKAERRRINCIRRCKALIYLIKGEEKKFEEITHIHKPYFYGRMPGYSLRKYIYTPNNEYWSENRVVIGNSATRDNKHFEMFQLLSKWKDKIKVFVPLSYGDQEYAKEVIEEGERIFDKNFYPIMNLMDKQEYIDLLSTCRVGIYPNDRQRAMGNIYIMLDLGRKVYIRNDITTYEMLREKEIYVHDVSNIDSESLEEFLYQAEEIGERNRENRRKNWTTDDAIDEWRQILEYEG